MAPTNQKKQATAPQKKAEEKAKKIQPTFANITVTNGVPAPSRLLVKAGELIHFSNEDNQDYLIQLFVDDDDPSHPAVDVLLPALGDCRLMADPGSADGDECPYNVVPTVLKKSSRVGSGSNHVIIITSGKAAAATAG